MTTSAPEWMQKFWDRVYRDEEAARVEKAEDEAAFHFKRAAAVAQAELDATIRGLLGMVGPKWDRARVDARAKFYADTAQARALFDITVQEILESGEMSEATDLAWDAIIPRPAPRMIVVGDHTAEAA